MKAIRPRRRLLTIGHSYVVGVNRRLAHELGKTGEWDVTAIAPARFRGDFAWHEAAPLEDERCTLVPVDVHFGSRVHVMLYGRQVARLLHDTPWDLVHCWEEPYVAAAAQIAAATPAPVPFVLATFQNIDKRYPPPFNWIERYAMGRADATIAFGRTAGDVLARRFPSARSRVIPPGVDAARFAPDARARAATREKLGWSDDVPVVGFLGRLVPEKGLATLMEALDAVDGPWRALIVGAGPLETAVRQWGTRYPGRVAVETSVAHDGVPAWLNAMDILCAPSETTAEWREQFGRMLIEAFACGIAVVASDSGEIPFVVADAGVIVPERNRGEWARVLRELLAQPERRNDMGRRGRARALAVYDWPVVARQHSDFFNEVIEGGVVAAVPAETV
jgi:glycosyltransferase involved in cell wall biosynthesis